jgi:hypothetical protein
MTDVPSRLNVGNEAPVNLPRQDTSHISPDIRAALAAHSPEVRDRVLRVADSKR